MGSQVLWPLNVGDWSPFATSGMESQPLQLPCFFSKLSLSLPPSQIGVPKQQFARSYSIEREGAFCPVVLKAIATSTAELSSNPKHWSVPADKAVHQTVEGQHHQGPPR